MVVRHNIWHWHWLGVVIHKIRQSVTDALVNHLPCVTGSLWEHEMS
jgi:hypothetical protein